MTRATGTHLDDSTDSSLLACHHQYGAFFLFKNLPLISYAASVYCTRITTTSNNQQLAGPVPIYETYGRAHGGQRMLLQAELSGRTETTDPIAGPGLGLYRRAVWWPSCKGLTLLGM